MGQKILGLDLGAYSIKGTLLERNWQDFTVLHFFERVNETDPALNPYQQLSYNLQKFLEENPLPPDTAIMAALPASLVCYRFIDLPLTNLKKIDQTMDFELENYVPLDMEKIWSDYHILSTEKGMSHILCAYTQLDDFRAFLNALGQNGLEPKQVSAELSNFANLARVAMLPREGHYALLDFGHRKTSIAIFEGETVRYLRTFGMGSADLTRAIAAGLDIGEGEAERLKREDLSLHPYLEEAQASPLIKAASGVMREWLVMIRQTLAAYEQSGDRRRVDALYLLGGGSRLSGLPKVLSSALKINIASLDSLAFTPHRLPDPGRIMPVFASAFATALRAVSFPKQIRLNFRKGEFAYRGDIEGLEYGLKKAAIWIAAIVGVGILHYGVSANLMSGKVDSVRGSMQKMLGPEWTAYTKNKSFGLNAALSMLNEKTGELREKRSLMTGAAAAGPLSVLIEISRNVPDGKDVKLNVDLITITETAVRLEGTVSSREDLDKIENALRGSPLFSDVKREKEEKGQKEGVQFKLGLILKEENRG